MRLLRKKDYPGGRFTLAFVGYGDESDHTVIELTHNWDTRALRARRPASAISRSASTTSTRTCETLRAKGAKITREPGPMKHGSYGDRLHRGSRRLQDRAHPAIEKGDLSPFTPRGKAARSTSPELFLFGPVHSGAARPILRWPSAAEVIRPPRFRSAARCARGGRLGSTSQSGYGPANSRRA